MGIEAEMTKLRAQMDTLLTQQTQKQEERSELEAERSNSIAVEEEMQTLQEEMESLLLKQAQQLEEEIENAKTEGAEAATPTEESPRPAMTMEIWEMTDEDVKELQKLKVALKRALGELETTRSVLREAIERVDASDVRSLKLEEELMILKADLQMVSTTMEGMRATAKFTDDGSPFNHVYRNDRSNGRNGYNGYSEMNGYNGHSDTNGQSDRRP